MPHLPIAQSSVFSQPRLRSVCPTLCFWHSLQKVTMPFFQSLKQSLCCFPVPTQQLLPSQSAPALAENGDWRTHTSMDRWARWRPSGCWDESAGFATSLFTFTPVPHLRLRNCCKETCRGVVGGATSLTSLHYFWPTYHTPPPSSLSVKERKTDICIASSYCTRFTWNLWVSIVKRAEEKNNFFVGLIFCCLFLFLKK